MKGVQREIYIKGHHRNIFERGKKKYSFCSLSYKFLN